MSNTIDVSCPECQKKIKATEELRGKKVRCKGCGHVFPIPAAEAAKPAAPAKPGPVKVVARAPDDEDGGAYSLAKTEETGKPRCPHCANELESETARICLNCGYDTVTRQRVGTKRTYETTAGDRTAWLMPGFIALGAIFVIIAFTLFYCLALPKLLDKSDYDWLAHSGFRLWAVIIAVILCLGLGRFAFQRLVLNPNPPEKTRG